MLNPELLGRVAKFRDVQHLKKKTENSKLQTNHHDEIWAYEHICPAFALKEYLAPIIPEY